MLDASSAAETLNSIASEEQRFHRIASAFRERLDAHDNPVAQAIVWMLGYRLVAVSQQSARDRHDPFAPDIEFPDFVFPPYLDDLSSRDDILSVWADLTRPRRVAGNQGATTRPVVGRRSRTRPLPAREKRDRAVSFGCNAGSRHRSLRGTATGQRQRPREGT